MLKLKFFMYYGLSHVNTEILNAYEYWWFDSLKRIYGFFLIEMHIDYKIDFRLEYHGWLEVFRIPGYKLYQRFLKRRKCLIPHCQTIYKFQEGYTLILMFNIHFSNILLYLKAWKCFCRFITCVWVNVL